MIYPKLSDGTIDWCVMCKHEGRDLYDGCCECEYPENSDDPPAKYEPKPMTNGDRIRSMTDEELAKFLLNRDLDVVKKASKAVGFIYKVDREQCLVNVIDWLKQGV